MKIAFKIPSAAAPDLPLHLIAEAGSNELSFLIYSRNEVSNGVHLHGFYLYNFIKDNLVTEYEAIVKKVVGDADLSSYNFNDVKLYYNATECTLVPNEYFAAGEKHAFCDLQFGEDRRSVCFYDEVATRDLRIVYRVPNALHSALKDAVPSSSFQHAALQILNRPGGSADSLHCTVYHNSVRIVAFHDGKPGGIFYSKYASPADVCYNLLNIVMQLGMEAEKADLVLSGMIDETSSLFTEIHRYFLHVSFQELSENAVVDSALAAHPQHFYSHLAAYVL